MSNEAITFRGLDNLLERLDSMADVKNVEKALRKACLIVERRARQLAPKGRTGDLRNSITHKVENLEGVVFTPLFYAPYIEYGTGAFREVNPAPGQYWVYVPEENGGGRKKAKSSKRYTLEEAKEIVALMRADGIEAVYTQGEQPQPFMRPALDENREEIKRILREGIIKND